MNPMHLTVGALVALAAACLAPIPAARGEMQVGERPLAIANRLNAVGLYAEAQEMYVRAEGADYAAGVVGASRAAAMVGEYAKAIDICRGALRSPAQDPGIATQFAELLLATGRDEEAGRILEQVVAVPAPPLRALRFFARLAYLHGQRDARRNALQRIADVFERGTQLGSADLTEVAAAYVGLERYHDANRVFREAARADPENLEARVLWGELYLAKYDGAQALATFEAALAQNHAFVPALVGAARASAGRERSGYAVAALAVNPRSEAALAVLAEDALFGYEFARLDGYLANLREVNPYSLDAAVLDAARAKFLEDEVAYAAIEKDLLARWPGLGEFHGRIADLLAHNYLFAEAEALARRAVTLDPGYSNGYTSLGMNLIRLGREEEGRAQLEFAFDKDPFNIWTSNTLRAFDRIENFETRRSEHFVVRMTALDAAVLWPYLEPLLEESWTALSTKYGFTPQGPVLVELFDRSSDFAVRSLGLPDIGPLVGICFGQVITLISPRTLVANWGEIIWHEFAHVITLQMTRNRLPRWLSEGISVVEANAARPEWGRNQDLDLVRAVQRGKLLTVARLNDGFTGAETNEDLGFAYHESELVVEFILERHGFGKLRRLVEAHARIRPLEEIVSEVFGVAMDVFEADFRGWIGERVARFAAWVDPGDPGDRGEAHGHGIPRNPAVMLSEIYSRDAIIRRMRDRIAKQPDDFQARLQLGIALYQSGEYDAAVAELEYARDLIPDYGGAPSPQQVLAELHEAQGDEEAALRDLESLVSFQQHDAPALMKLARHYWVAGDLERSRGYLERAALIDPYKLPLHELLGDIAKREKDYPAAIREVRMQLEIDRTDPVERQTELADLLLKNGDAAQARTAILAALEIAPTFARAQDILLRLVDEREARQLE